MNEQEKTLSVIVPSRGRPQNIARLLGAWRDTTNPRFTQLTVVVDHDDPEVPAYQALKDGSQGNWWDLEVQDKYCKLGPVLNAYAAEHARHYAYVGFMGDDHLPRYPLWDEQLCWVLEGEPGVAYGNDLFQSEWLPTAVVISSNLIKSLGYFQPPQLVHLYFDDFWKLLGQSVGNLKYRGDVVIEHLHPVAGKTAWDSQYAWTTSGQLLGEDGERYQQYLRDHWPAALARLKEELGLG